MSDDVLKFTVRARRSKSGHQYRAKKMDLRHLRDGRTAEGGQMAHSGRPELALQVVRPAQDRLVIGGTSHAQRFVRSVSYLWRFCDQLEASDPSVGKIDDVRMIPGAIWHTFTDHLAEDEQVVSNQTTIYTCCAEMVIRACSALGVAISLPSNASDHQPSSKRRTVEIPYTATQTREIVCAFRAERVRTQERIQLANRVADRVPDESTVDLMTVISEGKLSGREHGSLLTRENILHFVKTQLLSSLPDRMSFQNRYGFQPRLIGLAPNAMSLKLREDLATCVQRRRGEGMGLSALYRWFVPTLFDLIPFICELVHLTAGNLQTILDIDRNDWYRGHPNTEAVIVASRKARARGALISWDSETDADDTIYSIVKSAIEATAPLHGIALARLNELRKAPRTPDRAAEIDRLLPLRNRVWISLSTRAIGPIGIEQKDFHRIANEILRRHDVKENGQPLAWSARRVRDGSAEEEAGAKRLSPAKVQRKLQQASPRMAVAYLEQPRVAGRGTKLIVQRVSELMDDRKKRASFWPKRASSSSNATADRRTTILVMPNGRQWASRALPEAANQLVLEERL
jgi:hypothetical protein